MGTHDHLIDQVVDKDNPAFDEIPANLHGEVFKGGSQDEGWKTFVPPTPEKQAQVARWNEAASIRGSGSNIRGYSNADIISRVNAATTDQNLRDLLTDILKSLVE
jgi:hypothetical protein